MIKRTSCLLLGSLISSSTLAVEVYNSDRLAVEVGGNIQLMAISRDDAHGERATELAENGSRLNFRFTSRLNDTTKIAANFEWFVNTIAGDSPGEYNIGSNSTAIESGRKDIFTNRRSYFAIINDTLGTVKIGKMDSVYQHVTSATYKYNVMISLASATYVYGDGGITGTGRTDKTVQWSKPFATDFGEFTFELQSQLSNDEIDITDTQGNTIGHLDSDGGIGGAILYKNEGLALGVSHVEHFNDGQVLGKPVADSTATAASMGLTLGSWYLGAVANTAEQMYQDDIGQPFDGQGLEIVTSYTMGNWTPKIGHSRIEADDSYAGQYQLDISYLLVNYKFPELNFNVFAEAGIDSGKNYDGSDSQRDYLSFGIFYPF